MSPKLQYIIDYISERNLRHGKKLKKQLRGLSDEYYVTAEAFFSNYIQYIEKDGKSLEYGIDSYLKMLTDMFNEYLIFARTGEYSCKSFEDAYKKVYNNPDVMEYYMQGLLMSQYLWKHHHAMLKFFQSTLPRYKATRYLEIGGGHGLYLDQAMKLFGSDCYYEMVDISESSLKMAKTFINNDSITFKLQDIYEYKLEEPFDFITMGEVMEHVEDPISILKALGNLLSNDGTAFITTPTNAPAIDHIYLFRNEEEIEDIIRKSGFEIKEQLSVYSEDVTPEEGKKRNIALLYGAFIQKTK